MTTIYTRCWMWWNHEGLTAAVKSCFTCRDVLRRRGRRLEMQRKILKWAPQSRTTCCTAALRRCRARGCEAAKSNRFTDCRAGNDGIRRGLLHINWRQKLLCFIKMWSIRQYCYWTGVFVWMDVWIQSCHLYVKMILFKCFVFLVQRIKLF